LVTIEVVGADVGHQNEAERLPLDYATDDPRDDVIVIRRAVTRPGFRSCSIT
jgi:hypothetical protein